MDRNMHNIHNEDIHVGEIAVENIQYRIFVNVNFHGL